MALVKMEIAFVAAEKEENKKIGNNDSPISCTLLDDINTCK
jgi:hypothetical protein